MCRELTFQLTAKANKNDDVLRGTCSAYRVGASPQVLQKANEGATARAAESPQKTVNILASARTPWATESQETSQWKTLLGFKSNNLNTMQGN